MSRLAVRVILGVLVFGGVVFYYWFKDASGGDPYALEGIRLFEQGRYSIAVKRLQAAIDKGLNEYKPEEIYTIMGNAYSELLQFDKAIEAYSMAIDINSRYYKAWVNLGVVYRLTDRFDDAEECYTKAMEINPDYAELHISLGALYIFKNNPKKAVEHLERAVDLDPSLPVARSNLAVAYAMTGEFEKAESSLEQAARLGYPKLHEIKRRIEDIRKGAKVGGLKAGT